MPKGVSMIVSGLKIVLVEDSPVVRELLSDIIDDMKGAELVAEADAETAALSVIEGCHPDLAIIDLELSQGNGLNVLKQIRAAPERFGDLLAVVFSNHAHASVRERCRLLGAQAFFDKTFQMDELLEYIQAVVAGADRKPDRLAVEKKH